MTFAPVIALLGVSGVGKSRTAERIASARPGLLRLSAGGLLRDALHATGEGLRTADAKSIESNQGALAAALSAARRGRVNQPVLLETHAIIDNDQQLIDVPTAAMCGLGLRGILVLKADPTVIRERRRNDERRRRPERTAEAIAAQQERSAMLAAEYASTLRIPIEVTTSDEIARMLTFIDGIINRTEPPA